MTRISRFVLSLAWGAMTACGSSQELTQAPRGQSEVGLIIQGTAEETEAVLSESQSHRVISKRHGVYEVQGLSLERVKAIAPTLQVDANIYLDNPIQKSQLKSTSEQTYKAWAEGTHTAQTANMPPALEGCSLDQNPRPQPIVQVLDESIGNNRTLELGQTLSLSGRKSLGGDPSSKLELRWDVVAPQLSQYQPQKWVSEDFKFTPDSVGFFQAVLVAKNSQGACAATLFQFLVTHNPSIDTANETQRPQLDLTNFAHLNKVNATSAWNDAEGTGIIIAVLDTGLNYNHRAIQYNLAFNTKEMNKMNQADDDNNDFPDDVLGWDFVNGDNKPFDDEGHGSHVGGLTSSHIFGLAKNSRILPVKVLNAAGGGDVGSVIAGIYYAVDNGARVINASLQRLNTQVNALTAALEYANSKGVVFVSSAGNDSLDLSAAGVDIYPGEIDAPNVVNVAATGSLDTLTNYSNYGLNEVDVAAPGGDSFVPIYSLATLNAYDRAFVGSGGTSMAAPIVAGIAALVLEINPNLSPGQVKEILMRNGRDVDTLKNYVSSGKIIDAELCVQDAKSSVLQLF